MDISISFVRISLNSVGERIPVGPLYHLRPRLGTGVGRSRAGVLEYCSRKLPDSTLGRVEVRYPVDDLVIKTSLYSRENFIINEK